MEDLNISLRGHIPVIRRFHITFIIDTREKHFSIWGDVKQVGNGSLGLRCETLLIHGENGSSLVFKIFDFENCFIFHSYKAPGYSLSSVFVGLSNNTASFLEVAMPLSFNVYHIGLKLNSLWDVFLKLLFLLWSNVVVYILEKQLQITLSTFLLNILLYLCACENQLFIDFRNFLIILLFTSILYEFAFLITFSYTMYIYKRTTIIICNTFCIRETS